MRQRKQPETPIANDPAAKPASESPLSLSRLREAFAAMLGEQGAESKEQKARVNESSELTAPSSTLPADCEINPRSVIEAMLFVGRPDNGALSSRELATAMRGVSPAEIDSAVDCLNVRYDADDAPYRIDGSPAGYRLVLRQEFERMRDKFYGRVREAKLSPTVLEVLSVLAYSQPATTEQINQLRGAASGAALATLVRRRLVRLDRSKGGETTYATTDRFLNLFGLESLDALPRSEELEKI